MEVNSKNDINKELTILLNNDKINLAVEKIINIISSNNKFTTSNKVNSNILNRILSTLERIGEFQIALNIYKCCLQNEIINVDEKTSTLVIRCYLNLDNLKLASETLKTLKDIDIRKRTLIPFILTRN